MTTKPAYTQEQERDASRIMDIIASVPPEKRYLLEIATNAFLAGMEAQERIAAEHPAQATA